jgi:DNA-binding response OmpR family regulator
MKILVLDDDKDTCTLLKMFFERKDHEVHVCDSLIEGLKMIEDFQPDVLFIDNFFPDGEGWKAAKTIKVKYPDVSLNLMSAKDKSFTSLDDYDDVVWEKPISFQQLETYALYLNKMQQLG